MQNAREADTKTDNQKIYSRRKKKICPLTQSLSHSFSVQLCHQDQLSLLLLITLCSSSWKPVTSLSLEVTGHTETDNRQSDRQTDKPSLLIPVYSKWKPAADTLMSDWKVRYRLLDVLFSSWGIVVPVLYNIQKTVDTISSPYSKLKPPKTMQTCTIHEHILHLTYMQQSNNLDKVIILFQFC